MYILILSYKNTTKTQIFVASKVQYIFKEYSFYLFKKYVPCSPSQHFKSAINTAFGMSFISMIGMELSMNITDVILTGGAMLTWWAIPIMLFVGFITPLPYNYYKLKKYNIGCH